MAVCSQHYSRRIEPRLQTELLIEKQSSMTFPENLGSSISSSTQGSLNPLAPTLNRLVTNFSFCKAFFVKIGKVQLTTCEHILRCDKFSRRRTFLEWTESFTGPPRGDRSLWMELARFIKEAGIILWFRIPVFFLSAMQHARQTKFY